MNKQILYFYNPNCGHCNAFDNASKDFFRDNIDKNKDIELIKFTPIDIDNNTVNLNREILYKLKGTPTLLFIENGNFHEKLTVIGNNFDTFKESFNLFTGDNTNNAPKLKLKTEGICARVHKIEIDTGMEKSTCGVHKSEPVKSTCGVHKFENESYDYELNEDKPINICGKPKTDQ